MVLSIPINSEKIENKIFYKPEGNIHSKLNDVRYNKTQMKKFDNFADTQLNYVDAFTDGEVVDALEHFFWGMENGLVIELGALDGSPKTRSMTYEYEKEFGWHRILIEGDPRYREELKRNSPLSYSVNAAICDKHQTVHFIPANYIGGIIEFMSTNFLKEYHHAIYDQCVPPGNTSSLHWSNIPQIIEITCLPLKMILHLLNVSHVNYFILDVEGGELNVLKSINFHKIRFDVLSIETDPLNRSPDYAKTISEYLYQYGYKNATGQMGRNTWFIHESFIPSKRPGISSTCFNGVEKARHADRWYTNRRTPAFQKCPLFSSSS